MSSLYSERYVLLVQTDEYFSEKARLALMETGYVSVIEKDTHKGWQQLELLHPALVVLDWTFSGEAALKFCRQIRNKGNRIPVLMLLQTETIEDRVACLDAGADDYLVKPYHKEDFLKLVHLYLQEPMESKEQLRFGELILDLSTRSVLRQEQNIDLTMKEFELLKYLMLNPNKNLSREEIIENVWGYDYRGESNVIEVYIRYLRLKLESEGQKRLIHTVRGVGYVLRES